PAFRSQSDGIIPPMSSFRDLPSIDVLLRAGDHLTARYGHARTVEALRQAVEAARQALAAGSPLPDRDTLLAQAEAHLSQASRPTLRPVINATGVIIHTNLGCAPLSDEAIAARQAVAGVDSTLESDVDSGARGLRHLHSERLLREVTGAHASMVVNNNAAGVLLALSVLAAGREAIISRGEQVEIG